MKGKLTLISIFTLILLLQIFITTAKTVKETKSSISGTYKIPNSTISLKLLEITSEKIKFELLDQYAPDRGYAISGILMKKDKGYLFVEGNCSIQIEIQNKELFLKENNSCNEIGGGMSVGTSFNGTYKKTNNNKPKI